MRLTDADQQVMNEVLQELVSEHFPALAAAEFWYCSYPIGLRYIVRRKRSNAAGFLIIAGPSILRADTQLDLIRRIGASALMMQRGVITAEEMSERDG